MKKEKKEVLKELKNKRRRLRRLKNKASQLTDRDLFDIVRTRDLGAIGLRAEEPAANPEAAAADPPEEPVPPADPNAAAAAAPVGGEDAD